MAFMEQDQMAALREAVKREEFSKSMEKFLNGRCPMSTVVDRMALGGVMFLECSADVGDCPYQGPVWDRGQWDRNLVTHCRKGINLIRGYGACPSIKRKV